MGCSSWWQTGLTESPGEPNSPLCSLHGAFGAQGSRPALRGHSPVSSRSQALTISVHLQPLLPLPAAQPDAMLSPRFKQPVPLSHTYKGHPVPDTPSCRCPQHPPWRLQPSPSCLLWAPCLSPPLSPGSRCPVHHKRDTLLQQQDICHLLRLPKGVLLHGYKPHPSHHRAATRQAETPQGHSRLSHVLPAPKSGVWDGGRR